MHIFVYIIAGFMALGSFVIFANLFPDSLLSSTNPDLYETMRWTALTWLISGLICAVLLTTFGRISHLLEILVQQGRRTDHSPAKDRRDEKVSHELALGIAETDTGQFTVAGRIFESLSDAEAHLHSLKKY